MRAIRKVPAYLRDKTNDGPPMLAGLAVMTVMVVAFWAGVAAIVL